MIHNVHMHDDASQRNPSNIRSAVGKRANCAPTPVYKKALSKYRSKMHRLTL